MKFLLGTVCFYKKNISFKDVRHGNIATGSQNDKPMEAAGSTAQVIGLNYPCQINNDYAIVLDCHTAHMASKFTEFKENITSGKRLEDDFKFLKVGDGGIVDMVPGNPMCGESIADSHSLGSFSVCS